MKIRFFLKQVRLLSFHNLQAQWRQGEVFLSPILLTLILAIFWGFTLNEFVYETVLKQTLLLSQFYLTINICLSMVYSRLFEIEKQDDLFLSFLAEPLSLDAWFLAKYLVTFLHSLFILASTFLSFLIFNQAAWGFVDLVNLSLIALFCLLGLDALGLFLGVATLPLKGRGTLLSLLFFPLSLPLLLASIQVSHLVLAGQSLLSESCFPWFSVLISCDIIYLSLSFMSYPILIKAEYN